MLGRYALGRCAQTVPVLLVITVVVFGLVHLIPGDPATVALGTRARPDAVAALRREWGLDDPLWRQYAGFVAGAVTLDLGESFAFRVEVTSLLRQRLEVSLALILFALALSTALALPLGMAAALHPFGALDRILRACLSVTLVAPAFWVALLLLTLFSARWQLLPTSGYGTGWLGHARHLLLPATTIALGTAPLLARSIRAAMLDALAADHVRTARAKGLGDRAVTLHHVLRNVTIPAVTVLGLNAGYLLGGTVVVESAFGLAGIGRLLVEAVQVRDYPLLQAIALAFAVIVLVVTLATDLTHAALDPRIRPE